MAGESGDTPNASTGPLIPGHKPVYSKPLKFRYFLVADFEATCDENSGFTYASEIIEYPMILIDAQLKKEIARFHRHVRPTLNPTLTEFCTKLTGITQETVNNAQPFSIVFAEFLSWLEQHVPQPFEDSVSFVTDGPWDLRDFIQKELVYHEMQRPMFMKRVVDLRKWFFMHYGQKPASLADMMQKMGMTFEGREHCGLDDTYNISRIFLKMIEEGAFVNHYSNVHNKATKHPNWVNLRKSVNESQ